MSLAWIAAAATAATAAAATAEVVEVRYSVVFYNVGNRNNFNSLTFVAGGERVAVAVVVWEMMKLYYRLEKRNESCDAIFKWTEYKS